MGEPQLSEQSSHAPRLPPLVALVRRFGGSVSHALVTPGVEAFQVDEIDGAIAYRRGFGCAVAIGDPICAPAHQGLLATRFRELCARRGWHTVYVAASESFAEWARARSCATVEFGAELIMDPRVDPTAGAGRSRLRGKISRARRSGVTAAEYLREPSPQPLLERAIEQLVRTWLGARRGPQIYLASFRPFEAPGLKRWFVARHRDRVVGVLQLVRLDARDGYLFSQLVASADAAPGTSELLAVSALRALAAEGCGHVTWGPAPLAQLGRSSGLGPLSERLGRTVFRTAGDLFGLDSRNVFHRKFSIARTAGSYLLFDPPSIGVRELFAIMRAFHASVAAGNLTERFMRLGRGGNDVPEPRVA